MSRNALSEGSSMRINYFVSSRRWIALWVLVLAFPGLGFARPRGQSNGRACLQAAKRWLGASAEVVRCGRLTEPGSTEVVAILRLPGHKKYPNLYYVSKFIILRRTGPDTWTEELRADQSPPRNRSGYIGAGYKITAEDLDKWVSYGYAIDPSDHIMVDDPTNIFNNRPDFTLWLYYLNPEGQIEGASVEISWNPEVRRFQEFNYQVGFFIPATRKPPTHRSPVAPRKHP
jgi:hypothetical protein